MVISPAQSPRDFLLDALADPAVFVREFIRFIIQRPVSFTINDRDQSLVRTVAYLYRDFAMCLHLSPGRKMIYLTSHDLSTIDDGNRVPSTESRLSPEACCARINRQSDRVGAMA